jgi:hypothetical protein
MRPIRRWWTSSLATRGEQVQLLLHAQLRLGSGPVQESLHLRQTLFLVICFKQPALSCNEAYCRPRVGEGQRLCPIVHLPFIFPSNAHPLSLFHKHGRAETTPGDTFVCRCVGTTLTLSLRLCFHSVKGRLISRSILPRAHMRNITCAPVQPKRINARLQVRRSELYRLVNLRPA